MGLHHWGILEQDSTFLGSSGLLRQMKAIGIPPYGNLPKLISQLANVKGTRNSLRCILGSLF